MQFSQDVLCRNSISQSYQTSMLSYQTQTKMCLKHWVLKIGMYWVAMEPFLQLGKVPCVTLIHDELMSLSYFVQWKYGQNMFFHLNCWKKWMSLCQYLKLWVSVLSCCGVCSDGPVCGEPRVFSDILWPPLCLSSAVPSHHAKSRCCEQGPKSK